MLLLLKLAKAIDQFELKKVHLALHLPYYNTDENYNLSLLPIPNIVSNTLDRLKENGNKVDTSLAEETKESQRSGQNNNIDDSANNNTNNLILWCLILKIGLATPKASLVPSLPLFIVFKDT